MARPKAKPEAKADTKSEIKPEVKSETESETKSAPESEAYPNDDAAEPVLAQPVPGDGEPEAKPEAESESETESIRSVAVTASTWQHPKSEPGAAGSPLGAASHTLPSPKLDSEVDPESIPRSDSEPYGADRWTERCAQRPRCRWRLRESKKQESQH